MSVTISGSRELSKDDYYFDKPKHKPVIKPHNHSLDPKQSESNALIGSRLDMRVRLINIDNQGHSNYLVDECLQVNAPSDAFRKSMIDYWDTRYSFSKKGAWLAGIVTVLSGIGAVIIPKDPWVMTATAICALGSLLLTALNIHWAHKASHQKAGWEIQPTHIIAEKRKEAFEKGFIHVYENDLKLVNSSSHAILLPQEVQMLFERYFEQFCKGLLNRNIFREQQKKEWIDTFSRNNPLSQNMLDYAYDGHIPAAFSQVSKHYEAMEAFLSNLCNEFEQLKNNRHAETEQIITEINQQKEKALAPFKMMLTVGEEQAKNTKEKKLKELDESYKTGSETRKDLQDQKAYEKEKKGIEEECLKTLRRYQLYYQLATAPVESYFKEKVKEAKENRKKIIEEINANEESETVRRFNYAWNLLSYAQQVQQGQQALHDQYPQASFDPFVALHISAPSAPQLDEIDFVEQARHQKLPITIDQSEYAEYLRLVQNQIKG